jgi:hypothetical protein
VFDDLLTQPHKNHEGKFFTLYVIKRIAKNEMGRACSINGGEEMVIEGVGGET